MEESEDNLSTDDINQSKSPVRNRPKKRSLVERELETNLTARVTSPLLHGDGCSTSRYGRARRRLTDTPEAERTVKTHRSSKAEKSPKPTMQSPVYKMHASNSPIKSDLPKIENLDNQIENIYTENISLSRFGSVEKKKSPKKGYPKVYIRKDLIQSKDKDKEPEETVMLIKNMFSPAKSTHKSSRNSIDKSSEKYGRKSSLIDPSSVVKTLDFDEKKVKKETDNNISFSKIETFDLEAQSEYQVGDLVWARMGTYPFWPCIITREPSSGLFVKKKLFGRTPRNILNVTFFGDNGRRSWITDCMLQPFLGQLEFEAARSQFTPEAKKKDPKLYRAYFISVKKMPQWLQSVEEAEMLLREPKRLRIDTLNNILLNANGGKSTSNHENRKRVTRTDSDVSLSESLFDTLFSEEDAKGIDTERSRNKIKNKSLDVSDVVTACLHNMAAKTGITKIQRQSHMDRWLLKAKTKTPEKSHVKSQEVQKTAPNSEKVKKLPKLSVRKEGKPYSFRKRHNETQKSEQMYVDEKDCREPLENKSTSKDFTNDSLQNFESPFSVSLNVNDNVIDNKLDTEIRPSNDSSLIKPSNDLPKDIVTETCYVNGNDDLIENKNVLGDSKHRVDIRKNIPSSEDKVPGISTSSEIRKLNTQTNNIKMINETTDKNNGFLGTTEDIVISQPEKEISKDEFYQSIPITSSPNEKSKNTLIDSLTSSHHTGKNLEKIVDANENVDINTEGESIDVDNVTVNNSKECNIEKDKSYLASAEILEENNKINENILNVSNNKNITDNNGFNDIECHNPEADLKFDSDLEKTSIEKNENMTIDDHMSEKHDCNIDVSNANSSCISICYVEKGEDISAKNDLLQSESASNMAQKDTSNIDNSNNSVSNVEEISKNDSKFLTFKNFKTRSKNKGKKSLHNNLHDLTDKNNTCKAEEPVGTRNKSINHQVSEVKTNRLEKPDINCHTDAEKSNNNEIVKALSVQSRDNVEKNNILSITIDKAVKNSDLAKNKISNNELRAPNLVTSKSMNSYDVNHEVKPCLNQSTDINFKQQNGNIKHMNMMKESSKGAETRMLKSEANNSVITHLNQQNTNGCKHEPNPELLSPSLKNNIKQDVLVDNITDPILANHNRIENGCLNNVLVLSHDSKRNEKEAEILSKDTNLSKSIKENNLKNDDTENIICNDPDFQKYLELKQDSVMEEHPQLSQEEITNYLYKTWLYEGNKKSDKKVPDETSSVTGTNCKTRGRRKLSRKKPSDFKIFDTLQPSTSSTAIILNGYHQENQVGYSKEPTIHKIKIIPPEKEINDTTQDDNIENRKTLANELHLDKLSTKSELPSQSGNDALNTPQNKADLITTHSDYIMPTNIEATKKAITQTEAQELQIHEVLPYKQSENIDKKPPVLEDVDNSLTNFTSVVALKDDKKEHVNEKNENITSDESISCNIGPIASNDSEDKIKKRSNMKKSYVEKSMQEDSDFLKYLGFKQDSVIDEHPELSQDEVISYLYQTWLYEQNNKLDKKKSDEVDQTSLVKGANNTKIDKGRRRLSRKKNDDLKIIKTKQTQTIMKQLIIQNGYHENHDLRKTLKIKENEIHMFSSENTVVSRHKKSEITEQAIKAKKAIADNKNTSNKEIVISGEEKSFVKECISQHKEIIDTSDGKFSVQNKSTQNKEIKEIESFIQTKNIEIKENVHVSDGKIVECMQNNDSILSAGEPFLDYNIHPTKESVNENLISDKVHSPQHECIQEKEKIVVEDKSMNQNEGAQMIKDCAYSQNECLQTEDICSSCYEIMPAQIKSTQIVERTVICDEKLTQKGCTQNNGSEESYIQNPNFETNDNSGITVSQNGCTRITDESIANVEMHGEPTHGKNNVYPRIEDTEKIQTAEHIDIDFVLKEKEASSASSIVADSKEIHVADEKNHREGCTQKNDSEESYIQNVNFETNDDSDITVAQNGDTRITDESIASFEMHGEPTHGKNIFCPRIEDIEKIQAAEQIDIDFVPKGKEAPSASSQNSEELHVADEKNYREVTLKDDDTGSITSTDSEMSLSRRRQRWKEKQLQEEKKKAMMEPEFLRYLELRQDSLMDEHPELTEEEITNYLYKTWLYEENLKVDKKRTHEIDQTSLVKGVDQDANIKKVRRKFKVIKEDSEESFKVADIRDVSPKEKSKRSIERPYYNEEFSDVEEMTLFEIFRTKKKTTKSDVEDSATTSQTKEICSVPTIEGSNAIEEDTLVNEIDLVEMYFAQLTTPKPNLFKGLVRERVCEICEKVGKLVKCKTCHGMFHVDCVKNPKKTDEHTPTKGRKRGRKPRGRKPKNSDDTMLDSGSQSDERTQDISNSDLNVSIESEREPIVADAEDFEAKASAKMREILGDLGKIEYDYESSKVAIPWNISEPGKCQIVDVKLQEKRREEVVDASNFKCNNCDKYETPICFVCKSPVSPKDNTEHRQKCQVLHCHKYYHLECLNHWPQTQFNGGESRYNKKSNEYFDAMSCPRHVCHTCVSDDPRGCRTRFSADKLAKCVRCPATYHSFTKCLPAGSQVLTGSHIICPRHYEHRPGKVPCHVNTGWCFICALGGTLICCEYCPTSFHAECLNIDPPEGGYMCEDCETGRLPLYGEMVWVKLGHYRWWPGIILHPSQIPRNILAVKHSQGEFVVRFFGQYDHYWVNRGRVFPFQEGDTGKLSNQRSKIDAAFSLAVEHASRACEILKTAEPDEDERRNIAASLRPPHYVHLKVNKPARGLRRETPSSLTQCDCSPDEPQPCGPHSQCLNRMLLTECGPTCRAGDRCNNRAFERREYPRLEPYRTAARGWGLRCLEPIAAGQFVIEYVGEVVDGREFRRRMRRKHEVRDQNFYFLTLDKERMIDAGPKGNLARFMNHSCEPNCETQKWTVLGDVRVGLFALYDIPAESELTFNYNLECTGIEKKPCMCGAKRCSGFIGVKPKQNDPEPKKTKLEGKKHRKRKKVEEPAPKRPKQRLGRPPRVRELTEIEKDLLIIRSATSPGDGKPPRDGSPTTEISPHVADSSPPRAKSPSRDESSSVDRSPLLEKELPVDRGLKRAREPEDITVCLKRMKSGWSVG